MLDANPTLSIWWRQVSALPTFLATEPSS
jgi:hypothetical protein